jgi:hypothetical protein
MVVGAAMSDPIRPSVAQVIEWCRDCIRYYRGFKPDSLSGRLARRDADTLEAIVAYLQNLQAAEQAQAEAEKERDAANAGLESAQAAAVEEAQMHDQALAERDEAVAWLRRIHKVTGYADLDEWLKAFDARHPTPEG